jgi:hypothetical protein
MRPRASASCLVCWPLAAGGWPSTVSRLFYVDIGFVRARLPTGVASTSRKDHSVGMGLAVNFPGSWPRRRGRPATSRGRQRARSRVAASAALHRARRVRRWLVPRSAASAQGPVPGGRVAGGAGGVRHAAGGPGRPGALRRRKQHRARVTGRPEAPGPRVPTLRPSMTTAPYENPGHPSAPFCTFGLGAHGGRAWEM